MQAFVLLVVYLLVDQIFRRVVVNPVLEQNGIEPYTWSKHAQIKALTDYFFYWKHCKKNLPGILGILFSLALQIFMVYVIYALVKVIPKRSR